MATRLKTIEYWFPVLNTANDATDTNFTQITAYIPEFSGTVTFKSVILEVQAHNADTTAVDTTRRQLSISVGGAGYTVSNNTNTLTNSGEQYCFGCSADFTAHFVSNWSSGASKTIDARVLFDTAGSLAFSTITARLGITFEYDDTQATHVKTIRIPLNAPAGALAASKPGSATDTIPNLTGSFLPENSVVIRQKTIVVQGNNAATGTTDISLSVEVDSLGAATSQLWEEALNSDMWIRYVAQPSFTENATHSFYIWGSATKFNHLQVYMVVTYEFAPGATTTVLNSLMLPVNFDSPAGGTTSADYQRGTLQFWIEEPTTITKQVSGVLLFFENAGTVAGLNVRVNRGSFVAYTDAAATVCGGNGLMLRCESDITLARGLNTITIDVYRTDTTDLVTGMSVCMILNYTSGKATDGVGAHNHTVRLNLTNTGTAAATTIANVAASAFAIPETNYYINNHGFHYLYNSNSTGQPGGVTLTVERLAAESGVIWESIYSDSNQTDPEVGVRQCFVSAKGLFQRFPGDKEAYKGARLDIETSRRYRAMVGGNCAAFHFMEFLITYHSIIHTLTGTVKGYTGTGASITVSIFRETNNELVLQATTSAGGGYSFVWYDDTANLYASAQQDATHVGRSITGIS